MCESTSTYPQLILVTTDGLRDREFPGHVSQSFERGRWVTNIRIGDDIFIVGHPNPTLYDGQSFSLRLSQDATILALGNGDLSLTYRNGFTREYVFRRI